MFKFQIPQNPCPPLAKEIGLLLRSDGMKTRMEI